MELLIDKKYLIRLECYTKFGYGGCYDPFAVRYVFALPKSAGLPAGYTVYIDAIWVEWERDENGRRIKNAKPIYTKELENDCTYRLHRDNEIVYEATMTENREAGKRYKRYKYTSEELYALYQNVDLKTADISVAKIDIYLDGSEGNRHKAIYGNRIDKTLYLVGKVQGCWFYCSELDTKRRIGSRGVKILGKIKADNEAVAKQLISKYQDDLSKLSDEYGNIYGALDNVEKALSLFTYYDIYHTPKSERVNSAIHNIQKNATQAKQDILEEIAKESVDKANLASDLEKQLKRLYK
ncbi:MAG: hypothetical protein K2G44_04970 [Clostridia bacterium]|nr:hypothetical protein [Clostridia bacterium]